MSKRVFYPVTSIHYMEDKQDGYVVGILNSIAERDKAKRNQMYYERSMEEINEKIKLFKKYGINRISIGVQSIVDKNIEFLGRKHDKELVEEKIKELKENNFNNINIDLIYALPVQNMKDLKEDLLKRRTNKWFLKRNSI